MVFDSCSAKKRKYFNEAKYERICDSCVKHYDNYIMEKMYSEILLKKDKVDSRIVLPTTKIFFLLIFS